MLHLQIFYHGDTADAPYSRLAHSGGGYCSNAEMSVLYCRLPGGTYGIGYIGFGDCRTAVSYTLSCMCELAVPVNESGFKAEAANSVTPVSFQCSSFFY